jgi:hypothetical protein
MIEKFFEGAAIFQKYDLTCALVIMRDRYEAYNTAKLPKEDKKVLVAAGWKLKGGIWVLKKKLSDDG